MRKIINLILALTIVMSLTACGGEDPIDEPDPIIVNTLTTGDVYTSDREVTQSKLVNFEGPELLESSDKVDIQVEGTDIFVYETRVNHSRNFSWSDVLTKNAVAIFDFEGTVSVTMTFPENVNSAVVRPLSYGITPTIIGNQITFNLDFPTSYVVEINGDTENVVHLFAHEPETDVPNPNNLPDDMVYIGPGVHKTDAIQLNDGETLYLAGGAFLYGQLLGNDVENVTIKGRGIISGEIYPRTMVAENTIPFNFSHSKNIHLEGITFLDPAGWTINAYFLENFTIDGINIMSARPNGDGVSLQSCKDVVVKNSFVRSWDDSLVVKNYELGTTKNILFENMSIWTDLAQSMEIGFETNGATMDNIEFRDITVLHNFHKPIMSIHNADQAKIDTVLFRNITVEDANIENGTAGIDTDNKLIEMFIKYNTNWSTSILDRGSISNVLIENVNVIDGVDNMLTNLEGYATEKGISNVTFKNINIKGNKIETEEDLKVVKNNYVSDIEVVHNEDATGARMHYPYHNNLSPSEVEITTKENISQTGILVPDFARVTIPDVYMGQEVTGNYTASVTKGISARDWGNGGVDFTKEGFLPENLVDGLRTTVWRSGEYTELTDYSTISIDLDGPKVIGTIRIFGDIDSDVFYQQNIAVYGIKSSNTSGNYMKVINQSDYDFSPARGNYIDISINAAEFTSIQIRIYNKEGVTYPENSFVSCVEFYPASLAFGKSVIGTESKETYGPINTIDGNPITYYESVGFPAEIEIDLGDTYNVKYFAFMLPPLTAWNARTQEIEVQGSLDGITWYTVIAQDEYLFDPDNSNVIEKIMSSGVDTRYVKVIISSSSSSWGAQLSQIKIFD